jgi:hypothetical protein
MSFGSSSPGNTIAAGNTRRTPGIDGGPGEALRWSSFSCFPTRLAV